MNHYVLQLPNAFYHVSNWYFNDTWGYMSLRIGLISVDGQANVSVEYVELLGTWNCVDIQSIITYEFQSCLDCNQHLVHLASDLLIYVCYRGEWWGMRPALQYSAVL